MPKPLKDTPTLSPQGKVIGRPRTEPPANAAEIIRVVASHGANKIGIANALDVSRDTLNRWLTEQPDLQEAFDLGRERERHVLHNRLYVIATKSKDEKAASFAAVYLLNCRHGYRDPTSEQGARTNVVINLPGAQPLEKYITIEAKRDE